MAVFLYELRAWLRSPLFLSVSSGFFLFALVTMLGTGGFFDGPLDPAEPVMVFNSPYSLGSMGFLLARLLLFGAAVFGGFGLYKDTRNNAHAILYSFPISKAAYLHGKLCSALIALAAIGFLTYLGIWTGEIILGVDNPGIAPKSFPGYGVALGFYLFPTLVIAGVGAFTAAGISRSIFSGFVVVICFALFQTILENVISEQKILLALLDPFGQNAFHLATSDWDIPMQNSTRLPVHQIVLWNRILWLLLAGIIYGVFYRKFDFLYDPVWRFRQHAPRNNASAEGYLQQTDIVPQIRYDLSRRAKIKCFTNLAVFDFRRLLKNWMFPVLGFAGAATVFIIQLRVTNTGEFNLLPLTRLFLGAPLTLYTVITIFSTFLFSGLLITRARHHKMDLLVDATPVMDWQLLLSKIGAISLVQFLLLLLFLFAGLGIQILNGYYNFEFGLYLFHLFILVFPVLFVWNITSHLVYTVVPSFVPGYFFLAVLWLGGQLLEQTGISTNILKFNHLPVLTYSDFYGYGHSLRGYLVLVGYWSLLGLLLVLITLLLWRRGILYSLKERWILAKSRINWPLSVGIILVSASFAGFGAKVYKNERLDRKVLSATRSSPAFRNYIEAWEVYSGMPQPKITDIELQIDLYPHKESFSARGTYQLVNQGSEAIDTVLLRTGFDELTEIHWKENAHLLMEDSRMKSLLFKLNHTLYPGDSVEFSFHIRNRPNTWFTRNSNVLTNGSYLRQDFLPRVGYQFVKRELPLSDSLAANHNYFHRDANYVKIRTIISTARNQVAIAPGELISSKRVGARTIYEYASAQPTKLNYSFHSAAYETTEEEYGGVTIQLYHLNGHGQNTKWMLEGLKASLDHHTKWFGEYPHRQLRIIEFPHTEGSYTATLTCNNIPASEILYNMNTEAMEEKINLPFYVMAHELAHEWFGNQVMPADAEGAKMLTESIAEYITLCIYRDYFGEEMAHAFLQAQRTRYKQGLKMERGDERPLNKVLRHQEYIAYGKGTLAFDMLSKSIGEDTLHSILRSYLLKYRYKPNNYPTTDDFIQLLKANTPGDKHPLINHWFTQTLPVD